MRNIATFSLLRIIPHAPPIITMASYAARTKAMFQKYGRVAVGVHFAVYGAGLASTFWKRVFLLLALATAASRARAGWGGGGSRLSRHDPPHAPICQTTGVFC